MANLRVEIVKDESMEALRMSDEALEKALNEIGLEMERTAKQSETRVDTGLLRNSITYALDGGAPHVGAYKADKGDGHGSYNGVAPTEAWSSGGSKRAVYVGTNVEYAPYIEFGTSKHGPTPFLKSAVSGQGEKFREILKKNMENA